ncbi:hypothetical protein V5N11_002007 [Cardamine amara subsp. amara]|uniref:RNase H type-1 domain-containing protein n=1 Tax=Cardamine amara subsp. amara TaxID=228776 RepID=A0ABD0ZR82_CARAN
MWTTAGVPSPRNGWSKNSVKSNLQHIVAVCEDKSLPEEVRIHIPWILWYTWKARNTLLFERTRVEPYTLLKKAQEEATLWHEINKQKIDKDSQTRGENGRGHLWVRPPLSFVKCNIGVSWSHPKRNSGTSWIARDDRGRVLFHSRRAYSKASSRLEAELISIHWSVESLSNMRQTKVIFEISSRDALEAVKTPQNWPLFQHIL